MTIDELRPDLQEGPCAKCSQMIRKDENRILTCYKGSFVILHTDCVDFLDYATKAPRGSIPPYNRFPITFEQLYDDGP
jgi:hypothetical protein